MNLSFYTAAVGAGQQQQRMNIQGNNIANINTNGFKAQRPSFSSLMSSNLDGMDGTQIPRGTGARMIMADTDFSDGAVVETGRRQDYAIYGSGYFGLYDPATGEVSYTRDGSFSLSEYQQPDQDGVMETVYMLSDGLGHFVLSSDGGMIEVTDSFAAQKVGVYDFVNTDGMLHMEGNRLVPVGKNGQLRYGTGEVRQGVLETSNVDLGTELGKVIEAQRSYSYALKMVQTSDEIESTINGLRN